MTEPGHFLHFDEPVDHGKTCGQARGQWLRSLQWRHGCRAARPRSESCTARGMAYEFSQLVSDVIGSAIEVHRVIGPGLFESACERCLDRELTLRGIPFVTGVPVPLVYKGLAVGCGYRADLVVGGELLVELKSVTQILPVHAAQVSTYLRLLNLRQGLLINFNVPLLKDGVKSVVNPRYRAKPDVKQ